VLLTLGHLEECIKKTEGGNNENNEEVHDLECNVSLLLEIVPLVLNISKLSSVAEFNFFLFELGNVIARVLNILLDFFGVLLLA